MAAVLMQILSPGVFAQNTRPDAPAATPAQDRIIPLEATVNGAKAGAWPFVERQGALYVGPDALQEWRLQMPPQLKGIRVRGNDFYPLSAFPGFTAKTNYRTLSVDLTFAPEAFEGTRLTMEKEIRPKPSPVLPSVFVNYDLNFQHSQVRGARGVDDLGALLEFGASGNWGVFTSTHVGRNLSDDPLGERKKFLRLESTYTRDLPDRNLTLRLGDSSTRMGLWGRNVYFGGLQIGTNFALTPGFLTQPLPLLAGVSAAPSTVELYVNDQLRKVSQVPSGPFVIDDNVGLTGSGEARLVVRDVLGREVVIVQPFFTPADLLAPGLDDWSVETGALRENLGLADADYGHAFASGTWRHGLNNRVTLEGRAEATSQQQTAGGGAVWALPLDFLARGAFAVSQRNRVGDGEFGLLGLDRQWVRSALTVQVQGATRRYRELGMDEVQLPFRRQFAGTYTQSWGHTTLGLGLTRVERYDADTLTTLNLNVGYRFESGTALSAYYTKVVGQSGGSSGGVNVQIPLDHRRFASATVNSHAGGTDAYATVSHFGDESTDMGWRVLAGRLNNEAHSEAGLDYTGRYGRLYSDVSASPSQTSLRVGGSGGMAYAANRAFFSRRLDESFAIVDLKGYPGVGVGLGNSVSAVTDADGIAFVPYLSPYQANQVRLQASDLPISAELDSIEQIAVPSWRSAVMVRFPVRGGRSALVKMEDEAGAPIAPGSTVRLTGDKEEFFVGRRGEAFLTGLQPTNRVEVHTRAGNCTFTLTVPSTQEDVLRIGPVTCRSKP